MTQIIKEHVENASKFKHNFTHGRTIQIMATHIKKHVQYVLQQEMSHMIIQHIGTMEMEHTLGIAKNVLMLKLKHMNGETG